MSDIQENFIKEHNSKQEKINKIAEALKSSTTPKISIADLPDGSKQKVTEIFDKSGKPVYTVATDDKNVMTFASKKQLVEYLND